MAIELKLMTLTTIVNGMKLLIPGDNKMRVAIVP